MSSASLSEAERVVNRLKNSDPAKFEEYVRSRITEIVHLEVLEDFLASDNSHHLHPKRGARPTDWFKDIRKDRIKRKTGKNKESRVIGADLNCESVTKVSLLVEFLNKPNCLCEEGLFRKSGNSIRQRKLEEAFNHSTIELQSQLHSKLFSPHDVAGVLKLFLRELPEPLITNKPHTVYRQLADYLNSPVKILECLQLLLLLLPRDNHTLLKLLLELLHNTSMETASKMTAKTLGTLFAPHVLSCRPMDAASLKIEAESGKTTVIMGFMIENAHKLFKAPQSIVQIIEKHWKNLEYGEGEAVMNYEPSEKTSTDRALEMNHRYALAVDEDNDFQAMEIAKLQAVIASMPNSSKQKKKFIKRIVQTPTNYHNSDFHEKHKRTKSVGSALKKLVSKNVGHSKKATNRSINSPPPSGHRRLVHSQSDNCSPLCHRSPHCPVTSPPWVPVAKLFQEALDYTNHIYDESPTKEISHDPSRVVVVQHKNKKENTPRAEKAKIIMLKSPIKSKTCPRAATTIDFQTPKCEINDIISRRRDIVEADLPVHHPGRLPRSVRKNICTPTTHSSKVKTALKRKVPSTATTHSITKSTSYSSISCSPARTNIPESFRIAMSSPMTQTLDGSPLAKSLESAPHSIKKAIRTPRQRTPMAML